MVVARVQGVNSGGRSARFRCVTTPPPARPCWAGAVRHVAGVPSPLRFKSTPALSVKFIPRPSRVRFAAQGAPLTAGERTTAVFFHFSIFALMQSGQGKDEVPMMVGPARAEDAG